MSYTDQHLNILGLCFCCPEVTPDPNCILQKYRDEIILGKTDLVEKLSVDEANALVIAHNNCLQSRIRKKQSREA